MTENRRKSLDEVLGGDGNYLAEEAELDGA
jgi:hypothetical protein